MKATQSYDFPSDVELLVYDCDGVLTDNRVLVDEDGKESVFFNRGDGLAISKIRGLNIRQLVLSSEINPIIEKRCEKLKIDVIYGSDNKADAIRDYCAKAGISVKKVMFIGNDLNDLGAMETVGHCGCPNDAEREIIAISDWVSSRKGGEGVIRELYSLISKKS